MPNCQREGTRVEADTCPATRHIDRIYPCLDKNPRGEWNGEHMKSRSIKGKRNCQNICARRGNASWNASILYLKNLWTLNCYLHCFRGMCLTIIRVDESDVWFDWKWFLRSCIEELPQRHRRSRSLISPQRRCRWLTVFTTPYLWIRPLVIRGRPFNIWGGGGMGFS